MKGTRKPRFPILALGIALLAIGLIALILLCTVLKDWVLIGYGIRVFSKIKIVTVGVLIVGALLTVIGGAVSAKVFAETRMQKESEKLSALNRSRTLENFARDSNNPDNTRERLELLRQENPDLDDLVNKCLLQMDEMDTLQEKQADLIEANDARYLRDTIGVLDNVERRICRNFRNVVNICIAADSAQSLDMGKIGKYLGDNRKKLSDTKELLRASADWINQYNAGEDNDRSEVESWIEVIRESLKEE